MKTALDQLADVDHMQAFLNQIRQFNEMYRLPSNSKPTDLGPERIRQFIKIMTDELGEGYDIAEAMEQVRQVGPEPGEVDPLVSIADLLGDLAVFVFSEARRWGIPMEPVLEAIMESNASKLGLDGQPIYDEKLDKVLKGPLFVPPEPAIKKIIEEYSR